MKDIQTVVDDVVRQELTIGGRRGRSLRWQFFLPHILCRPKIFPGPQKVSRDLDPFDSIGESWWFEFKLQESETRDPRATR